jgi:hypothetical protein
LTLGPQLAVFLQKHPSASVRVLVQPFPTSVPTIKEIIERKLGLKKFPRRWPLHYLSPTQKLARIEASIKMPRTLHELEENHFE